MGATPQNALRVEACRRRHLLRLDSLEMLSNALVVGIAFDGASHGLPNDCQGRLDPSAVRPLHSTAQASYLVYPGVRRR